MTSLDRFFAIEIELERVFAWTRDKDLRNKFAIIRGWLELTRAGAEPLNVDFMERELALICDRLGSKERFGLLRRLRCVAGWARLTPAEQLLNPWPKEAESLTGISQDSSGEGVTRNDTQRAEPS